MEAIKEFLTRNYRLIKELWAHGENPIAIRFQYEWCDDGS
jgi:nuclear transport factor 2 (NTF2) superfamily protein